MKPAFLKSKMVVILGWMLTLPTSYFILMSVLKYELNSPRLFDATWPLLERLGVRENIGWNINLLILFGPVLAFVLNLLRAVDFEFQFTKERWDCKVSIHKSWWNLSVIFISSLVMLFLFAYFLGENCNCHS